MQLPRRANLLEPGDNLGGHGGSPEVIEMEFHFLIIFLVVQAFCIWLYPSKKNWAGRIIGVTELGFLFFSFLIMYLLIKIWYLVWLG